MVLPTGSTDGLLPMGGSYEALSWGMAGANDGRDTRRAAKLMWLAFSLLACSVLGAAGRWWLHWLRRREAAG